MTPPKIHSILAACDDRLTACAGKQWGCDHSTQDDYGRDEQNIRFCANRCAGHESHSLCGMELVDDGAPESKLTHSEDHQRVRECRCVKSIRSVRYEMRPFLYSGNRLKNVIFSQEMLEFKGLTTSNE